MSTKNNSQPKFSILVVCLGNICRSPAAQGILAKQAQQRGYQWQFDSAGTAAYHVGKHPDPRSIAELASRGIDISSQRARQVTTADFDAFDYVLAMDESNLANLLRICPPNLAHKVKLFTSFDQAPNAQKEVADPYYGAESGFSVMADHLTHLSHQFLDYIATNTP